MMILKRLPNWRPKLVTYIQEVAALRFRPGHHDCALFAAGAVNAQTGVDLAEGWHGYRSLGTGQRKLIAAGFDDHVALVASLLPEVSPLNGHVGDIAILDGSVDKSLGVVQGPQIYVLTVVGLSLLPLTAARRMFRV